MHQRRGGQPAAHAEVAHAPCGLRVLHPASNMFTTRASQRSESEYRSRSGRLPLRCATTSVLRTAVVVRSAVVYTYTKFSTFVYTSISHAAAVGSVLPAAIYLE
jgi:hypothetical protein